MELVSGTHEPDNAERKSAWEKEAPGRSIDEDGVGWWEAREHGILVKRRQQLGDLMDALAERAREAHGR